MKYGQLMMPSTLSAQKFISLSFADRLGLNIQRYLSQVFFVIFGPIMNYLVTKRYGLKVNDLEKIRNRYRELLKQGDGPLLICPNHLTLIDSVIHAIFLNSLGGYFLDFSSLPWNLPERKNFTHKLHWSLICYLGKCIPVERGAPPSEGKRSLQKMLYILKRKQVLSIFPEGKRSRTGDVDTKDYSYGVGQIIKQFPSSRVICLYMRGKKSGGFGNFPAKGEEFYLQMEMINPKSDKSGLRKVRDLSKQVITKLAEMEKEYYLDEAVCR